MIYSERSGTMEKRKATNSSWLFIAALGTLLTLLTGCSGGTSTGGSSPAQTRSATSASSSTPTMSTTSSTSTTTSIAEPGLPTYSEVVATYPANITICNTVADYVAAGFIITGGDIYIENGQMKVPWYGIKITVKERWSVNGKTYEVGAKLTWDANGQLIAVSSWD